MTVKQGDSVPIDALAKLTAKRMSEDSFQWRIVELARFRGWIEWHQFDSRRSRSGWPDLVLLRPPSAVFWEVKTEKGPVSQAQRECLEHLRACGLNARVVRPSDWDYVVDVLTSGVAVNELAGALGHRP